MFIETGVLDRQEGIDQTVRHLFVTDVFTKIHTDLHDLVAIRVIDHR